MIDHTHTGPSTGRWGYCYNPLMMDLKKKIATMMLSAGENIAKLIVQESFNLWKRKDFRMYIDFDNISQTEQDRIFNELEVSLIGLYVMRFDQAIDAKPPKEKELTFKALRTGIIEGFLQYQSSVGIDEKFIKQWRGLIDMRLKEYREDLKIAMKMSENDENFSGKDASLRPTWARVETMKIDCLSHIKRGKFDEKDPLWKFLTKWFITMDAKIAPITDKL